MQASVVLITLRSSGLLHTEIQDGAELVGLRLNLSMPELVTCVLPPGLRAYRTQDAGVARALRRRGRPRAGSPGSVGARLAGPCARLGS